ncbi:MAG TPA: YggS family pyridoxal phosphate-dependent enzyme, partial [Blastocatellia bacterium]|nr:YggS family pyridoxal phosphate-dependent enzyme [Blastocatellia bacterium]
MAEAIKDNLARVRAAVAQAAARAGRRPEEVKIIAVSKTFDAAAVQQAVDAGALDLGENRVQEAAGKVDLVKADGLRWHLIGHLQSNKARLAVKTFDVIHTVDTVELAERLDRVCGEEQRRLDVLVQVDLGHEATKTGADEAD